MRKNLIFYICFIICIVSACKNKGEFVPASDTEAPSVTEEKDADVSGGDKPVESDDGTSGEDGDEKSVEYADGTSGEDGDEKSVEHADGTSEEVTTTESEAHYDKDGRLRINYADKNELVLLTGIGEKKAEAIVEYREQYGYFNKVEDIKKVKGIKDGTFNKIKDHITIN